MSTTAPSKYYIKSLEDEIGLFDRKLAHLLKFESFATEKERNAAAGRLTTKRERLIETIRELTEGKAPEAESAAPKKAPKKRTTKTSPRSKTAATVEAETPVAPIDPVAVATEAEPAPRPASPYAGTSLDYEQELQSYLDNRKKPS